MCETPTKRSGAYSMGVPGVHPYMLLNYQKTTHDVFTIAHEMGHSMHTYYSEKGAACGKSRLQNFRSGGGFHLQRGAAAEVSAFHRHRRQRQKISAAILSGYAAHHNVPSGNVCRIRADNARHGGKGTAPNCRKHVQKSTSNSTRCTTARRCATTRR